MWWPGEFRESLLSTDVFQKEAILFVDTQYHLAKHNASRLSNNIYLVEKRSFAVKKYES